LNVDNEATFYDSKRIALSRPFNDEAAAETSTVLKTNQRVHQARVGKEMKTGRKERLANKSQAQQAPSDSFSDSPNWEAKEPQLPTQHQAQDHPASLSNAPVLSHEHLLERVTLLERLMALKAEEDMLKKQNGQG
jgi:hypothetical protein